jgi:hypothetical protein
MASPLDKIAQAGSLVAEAQNLKAKIASIKKPDNSVELSIRADLMIVRAEQLRFQAALALIVRSLQKCIDRAELQQHVLQVASDVPEPDRRMITEEIRAILGD